ncbi:MAG: cysteine desulfurase [Patescibacteria group bacterium]
MIDAKKIKKDFPIFEKDRGLVYLDSTATSLKPSIVIDKLAEYYSQYSANIFRGVYAISERATVEYENTRKAVAGFINAQKKEEVVFTRNTTETINLIAYSWGRKIIAKGDEIVTTVMEHHSNFVPWQVLAGETGAVLKVIDINENGDLQGNLEEIITKKTKILALAHVSNVLGTINPVKEIVTIAKRVNPKITVVVDAAQAVPHMPVDVQSLGCDFLAFSSHKMLGPTGVGVLWGKYELLDEMFPFMYGGEMIEEVFLDNTTFKRPPHKFEAGTPAIAEVIALKSAIVYLSNLNLREVRRHEKELVGYAIKTMRAALGNKIRILGPADPEKRAGVLSFTYGDIHPHDVASILDEEKIAVRAGHHCAMPLHTRLGINATIRASFYVYNSREDVDKLIVALKKAGRIL